MISFAHDGASLSRMVHRAGRCLVCDEEVGSEPWWVVPDRLPDGEHSRCRDYTKHPFPFAEKLNALRRAWSRLADDDAVAKAALTNLGRELAALETAWPKPGHVGVERGAAINAAKAVLRTVPDMERVLFRL
jgi:hypothetical protein